MYQPLIVAMLLFVTLMVQCYINFNQYCWNKLQEKHNKLIYDHISELEDKLNEANHTN